MPAPPPPPPPPPPPGVGFPPPSTPLGGMLPRPSAGNRKALLSDIHKGKALKKTVTDDRSAPTLNKSSSSGPPVGGAPPIPGGLAPPVPGNRARSNSDHGSGQATVSVSGLESALQLGGLFASGMPKLKKRGGGVDTGANANSSYLSDPEDSMLSGPKASGFSAPKPPPGAAPVIPGRGPPLPPPGSLANLRRTSGPASSKGPPPPVGKKPPPLPTSQKPTSKTGTPSAPAPPPPPPSSSAPGLPLSPRPPLPAAAPPRPVSSPAPRMPLPFHPHGPSSSAPSLAAQAAIRAAEQSSLGSSTPSVPPSLSLPTSPPPPRQMRSRGSSLRQSLLDPSAYTLSSNGSKPPSLSRHSFNSRSPDGSSGRIIINDTRWQFKDESLFPKPRDFIGGTKKYRAGRGSSVPLDLGAL